MMYKIFLIELLGIFLFESCYDDKGNYSYRAINEITVKHTAHYILFSFLKRISINLYPKCINK